MQQKERRNFEIPPPPPVLTKEEKEMFKKRELEW
jgi:hypothetical protein